MKLSAGTTPSGIDSLGVSISAGPRSGSSFSSSADRFNYGEDSFSRHSLSNVVFLNNVS